MMTVGVCRIWLRLPENQSLKGKRQVIRSLSDRLRHRFNVAIAEVSDNDSWQMVSLGISCVSNNSRHAQEVLDKVVAFVEANPAGAEVVDYQTEVFPILREQPR